MLNFLSLLRIVSLQLLKCIQMSLHTVLSLKTKVDLQVVVYVKHPVSPLTSCGVGLGLVWGEGGKRPEKFNQC